MTKKPKIMKGKYRNQAGYTMIELLIAVVVGAVVLTGAYSSYLIIAKQFEKNQGASEIRDMAIPTISILTRDLRMTGSRYYDSNIESTYGRIDNPITITSGTNFDSFSTIYDREIEDPITAVNSIQRTKKTFYTQNRNNPERTALYIDIETWDGTAWVVDQTGIILSDYIESFKISGEKNNSDGDPTLIHLNIVFRSRNKQTAPESFIKSSYGVGGNIINVTDNYKREEFETSVFLRNLAY